MVELLRPVRVQRVAHMCGPRLWAEGGRYARYWPQARLVSTTGLGHHRIANDPKVMADAIAFLQGQAVGERVVSTPALPFGVC